MALPEILLRIDALKHEADGLRPIDKAKLEVLNAKLRLEWTFHSNAIEGNTLTLSETRVLLQQGIHMGNKLGRHYEEMKLHEDVILTLEEIVHSNRPFNEVLIRQLHHQLMGDDYFVDALDSLGEKQKVKGKPGEYKDQANGVERIVNGKKKFVPFKTPDEVRIEMPELISWYLAEEEKKELHPVAIAAFLHYRFVTLHPFDDGNGRMGRILMNLALMRAGYVPAIVRVEEREAYIRNLAIAQDGGDLNPFVELVAEETLRSMELLVKAAKGESIEEPDDIEKKFALLRRSLVEEKVVTPKTTDVVIDLFKNSFKPLLELLERKIESNIKDLFAKVVMSTSIQANGGASMHGTTIKEMEQHLEGQSNHKPDIHKLNFDVSFQGFIKDGVNTFYSSASLELKCSDYFYTLQINGADNIIKKLYTETITEEEQRHIVSKVLEDVFEQIQRNIKK